MEYCPHCMQPTEGVTCHHCGGLVQWTAPSSQLPLGTILRGTHVYQIGAAKGQGGFGITYAAMDLMTNQRVAIKEYYPNHCASRERGNTVMCMTGQQETYGGGMRSFLEEAHMLSAVGALPSVVSVRDFFEANGTAYLVMEYVDGKPLHQVLSERGPFAPEQLLPLLPTLLRDLDTLHRSGVIHRDISPDNLILTREGTLKLLDFGAARSTQSGKSMTVMLKAGFSPVEQYQSKGQGSYTDVYALAGTIYYCLTGMIPPTAVDRIAADELKAPSYYGVKMPKQQEDALLWGMTVQPKNRPQTMAAFANAMFPQVSQPADVGRTDVQSGAPAQQIPHSGIQQVQPSHRADASAQIKEKTKKSPVGLIAGICAAVLAVAVLIVVLLGGTKTTNGYQYKLQSGDAYIVGYEGAGKDIIIPDTLSGHTVVGIREGAFEGNTSLYSVTIPYGIEILEQDAFADCTNLEIVRFEGNGSLTVEAGAFRNCRSLLCVIALSESQYNRLQGSFSGGNQALCYVGQEFLGGRLQNVRIVDGIVYAITDQHMAIVLTTASGVSQTQIPGNVENYRVFDRNGQRIGVRTGTNEDGFTYEILGNQAILLGYSGNNIVVTVPETLESCPVTTLASGAFAGNTEMESLFLPNACEMIESGALSGCSNLRDLYAYGPVKAAQDAFRDCTSLRCVVTTNMSVRSWNVSSGCIFLENGIDTGAGILRYVDVADDGVVYGVTDQDLAVVIDVPGNLQEVNVLDAVFDYPVTWIYSGALDRARDGVLINLAANTGFPYEMYPEAEWNSPGFGAFSQGWIYSCYICHSINANRSANEPKIYPERAVVEAALIRAEETGVSNSHTRPDGNKWSTVLDDLQIDWASASTTRQTVTVEGDSFEQDYNECVDELIELYTPCDEEGRYYTAFGTAAYYKESANELYINTLAIIRE